MTRGGRPRTHESPERRCLATGEVQPKHGLIRFVVGPGDVVVPDIPGKLPGRGLYVSADRAALEQAVKRRLFARGAKQAVTVPDGLVSQVETALGRRVLDLLSLARKAGRAVAGYEKVKDWLAREEAVMLLQAADGSERGKTKLRPPPGRDSFCGALTAQELGLSFGRNHVIHAALAAGGLTESFREDVKRLSGVRANGGGEPTGKEKTTI